MNACFGATRNYFILVVLLCLACQPSNRESVHFEEQPFTIADYGLFDLGVADMNDDGRLDIFTTNHSGEQSFLLNQDPDGFKDVYADWKMDQDHQFPGLAIFPEEPVIDKPGVYINWVGPDVYVRTKRLGSGTAVSGRIDVYTSIKILKTDHFKVEVKEKNISPDVDQSVIHFSGEGDGHFIFRPLNHALPFQFHFDENVPVEAIHVGKNYIAPKEHDFAFQLKDRHGMVWNDFNDDNQMDVFILRGGERGLMGKLPIPFWDELFIKNAAGMEDVGAQSGLAKKGCPGRQAGLIDYDQDNLLDIYLVCGRNPELFPNMLFHQTSESEFEDAAVLAGLDIPTNGAFIWLDVDLDGDMDMLWSDENGYFFYANENGKFSPTPLETFNRKSFRSKFTVGDYDNDGDLDIFSASLSGNVLFVNTDGKLSAVLPMSVGLPDKSTTANWVDIDNDGRMDLHVLPQGLYIQKQHATFVFASQLGIVQSKFSPFESYDARCMWFDIDSNGTRDLLMATQWQTKNAKWARWWIKVKGSEKSFGGLPYGWKVALFKNQNTQNHWLQVQLKGPRGNRQAIGARVTLQTDAGKQLLQVGHAECSHYSQGHYRLYFGTGSDSQPSLIRVDWPDGKSTEILQPPIDRLLTIDWSEA